MSNTFKERDFGEAKDSNPNRNIKIGGGILGSFAKLRKATIIFIISVCLSACPSVHMEQLGSQSTDIHEILYMSIFRKYVDIFVFSFKTHMIDGYITRRRMYV